MFCTRARIYPPNVPAPLRGETRVRLGVACGHDYPHRRMLKQCRKSSPSDQSNAMLRRRMPTPSCTASAEDAVPGVGPSAGFAKFLLPSPTWSPAEIQWTAKEKEAVRAMLRSREFALSPRAGTCHAYSPLRACRDRVARRRSSAQVSSRRLHSSMLLPSIVQQFFSFEQATLWLVARGYWSPSTSGCF